MTATKPFVAATPAAMTVSWFNQVFAYLGNSVQVAEVRSAPIGTGQSAHSERFQISYSDWDGRAPKTLVAKLPHPDPVSRRTGHVHGSYAREVFFYQQVAPTVGVRTPKCLYADIDGSNSDFVLLLEDMAPAQQGDQMRGCSLAEAECAVREIAKLHAPRWGDPTLLELRFLSGTDPASTIGRAMFDPFWQGFLKRYAAHLSDEILRVGEGLAKHYEVYAQRYAGARCPTHGDYRLDNVLIGHREGAVNMAVVDWQTAGVGCGTSDVAYFLGAGLLPEMRRRHERELLGIYLQELKAGGVKNYEAEQVWEDYRHYSYAGYVMAIVASMLVVQTERGDEMFLTMANRHGQHALDVEAERLLASRH